MPLFEAAALVAHPALVDVLKFWIDRSDDEWLNQLACDALEACEKSHPIPN